MTTMFRKGSLLVAALALLGAVGAVAPAAHASTNVYAFTARGTISDFNEGDKTFKADVTTVDQKRARADLNGNNTQFVIASNAVVVKYNNTTMKDTRVTYHNLAIGQEVAFKGFKKDNDTYVVTFIRISDRSFTVVGNLKSFDNSAQTLTILVTRSTYQPNKYVKKNVKVDMTFNGETIFYTRSGTKYVAVSSDTVNADAQLVKVMGTIDGTNTWKVAKFWDKYKGK